jgi:hypothetical protein
MPKFVYPQQRERLYTTPAHPSKEKVDELSSSLTQTQGKLNSDTMIQNPLQTTSSATSAQN